MSPRLLLVLCSLCGCKLLTAAERAQLEAQIEAQRNDNARYEAIVAEIDLAEALQAELRGRLAVLEGLRGAPTADTLQVLAQAESDALSIEHARVGAQELEVVVAGEAARVGELVASLRALGFARVDTTAEPVTGRTLLVAARGSEP